MKKYKVKNMPTVILEEVICDECGKKCKNMHFDVLIKASFSDRTDFVKTVCFDCYEKEYKETVVSVKKNV